MPTLPSRLPLPRLPLLALLLCLAVGPLSAQMGLKWGYGFGYQWDDDGTLQVTGVVEGSPASEKGLQVGDVILAIRYDKVSDLGRAAATAAMQNTDKTLSLRVRRGEETLDLYLDPKPRYAIGKKCLSGDCENGDGTAYYEWMGIVAVGTWDKGFLRDGTEYASEDGSYDPDTSLILRKGIFDKNSNFTGRRIFRHMGRTVWLQLNSQPFERLHGDVTAYTSSSGREVAFKGGFGNGAEWGPFEVFRQDLGFRLLYNAPQHTVGYSGLRIYPIDGDDHVGWLCDAGYDKEGTFRFWGDFTFDGGPNRKLSGVRNYDEARAAYYKTDDGLMDLVTEMRSQVGEVYAVQFFDYNDETEVDPRLKRVDQRLDGGGLYSVVVIVEGAGTVNMTSTQALAGSNQIPVEDGNFLMSIQPWIVDSRYEYAMLRISFSGISSSDHRVRGAVIVGRAPDTDADKLRKDDNDDSSDGDDEEAWDSPEY